VIIFSLFGSFLLSAQTASVTPRHLLFSSSVGSYSAYQNFSLTASGLTPSAGYVSITAPTGFRIYEGGVYYSVYNLIYSGGIISSANVPVVFYPTDSSSYSGRVYIASGTDTLDSVCVSGNTGVCLCGSAGYGYITGDSIFCSGATSTMTGSFAGGSWSSSNTAVATVTSGVVSGVSAGTCIISYTTSVDTATKAITINPLPSVAAISGSSIVATSSSITLTDSTSGGTWSTSNSHATIDSVGIVTGISAGVDTISYTLSGTCGSAVATHVVTVTPSGSSGLGCNIITTIAGNGSWSYSGDGGSATGAGIDQPVNVAIDSRGNIYIVDYDCIRKVNRYGIITTIAGNGIPGYSGDGGQATAAQLNDPECVAVDHNGNLYIADYLNNRIRKVDTSGIITTIAGNSGYYGYSGDGGPATAAELAQPVSVAVDAIGNLYIADESNSCVRKVDTGGYISTIAGGGSIWSVGDGGPATAAFLEPNSIALDTNGNLYISDHSNNRIRKVNSSGIITSIAGSGISGYFGDGGPATAAEMSPVNVAVDRRGNVYFVDESTNEARMVNNCGIISLIGGNGLRGFSGDGGPSTAAELFYPGGIVVDSNGNIYLADGYNGRIRKITNPLYVSPIIGLPSVGVGATVALADCTHGGTWSTGGSYASVDSIGLVTGISEGVSIISYTSSATCGSVVATFYMTTVASGGSGLGCGMITTVAGNGSDVDSGTVGPATADGFYGIEGVAVDKIGNLFITDGNLIRKVDTSGIISTFAGTGTAGYSGDGGAATDAELNFPRAVALDSAGNLYIGDTYNNLVRKVNTSGIISTFAGDSLSGGYSGDGGPATAAELYSPTALAVDGSSNVYIASGDNRIRKVNTSGIISLVAGTGSGPVGGDGGPATAAGINTIDGMAFDSHGNLYLSDGSNGTIREVNTSGIITTIAGNGATGYGGDGGAATNAELDRPQGVAVDANGNIYFADINSGVIRRIDTFGIITTFAGNGIQAFSGDGGAATNASLHDPSGLAVGAFGNIYIIDNFNNRVRKVTIDPPTFVRSIFGSSSLTTGSSITLTDSTTGGTWSAGNGHASIDSVGIVTGISAGVDTISYTLSGTCGSAVATHIVTINTCDTTSIISGAFSICAGSNSTLIDSIHSGVWSASNGHATVSSTGVVTGITAGIDTIRFSYSLACGSGTATHVVTIMALPNAGVITGTTSLCAGSVTTLTDAVPGGSWTAVNPDATVDSGIVTAFSGGIDTIKYFVSNSCGGATAKAIINITPLPVAGVIIGADSVCVGSIAVETSTASGGMWSLSNANATISGDTLTGIAAGADTLYYTDSNSCGTDRTSIKIFILSLPVAGVITGRDSLCAGSSLTLTDTTTGGMWSSWDTGMAVVSGGLVTAISGGVDTIVYSVTNYCGTATAKQPVLIKPLANAGIIIGADSICALDTALLTETASGGIWISTDSSTALINVITGRVTALMAGTDTIKYAVTNSCSTDTATRIIYIRPLPVTGALSVIGAALSDSVYHFCSGIIYVLTAGTPGGVWTTGSSSLTIFGDTVGAGAGGSTGILTYTVTSPSCGSASGSLPVSIDTPVTISITGNDFICLDSSLHNTDTLTGLPSGGVWSIDSSSGLISATGIVTDISAAVATVNYAVANGCGSFISSFSITALVVPVVGTITSTTNVCIDSSILLYCFSNTGTGIWSVTGADAVISINPVTHDGIMKGLLAGTAEVTFVDSNGCGRAASSKLITINPIPVPATITGPQSVCIDSTITLLPSYAGGFWLAQNGNAIVKVGSVSGIHPGTDSISYIDSSNCGVVETFVLITVNPAPAPAIARSGTSLSTSDSFVSYQWFRDSTIIPGATNANYVLNPSDTGLYSVFVTNASDCGGVGLYRFNGLSVQNIVGNRENLNIYPNPNTGSFTIHITLSGNSTAQFTISNVEGQEVLKFTGNTNEDIDVKHALQPGIYFVTATTSEGNYVQKVVVME